MIGRYFLANLVGRRSLLYQLVRRDFEQRFVGSVAGWLWGLIHPLVLVAAWTFVFQWCLRSEVPPGEVTQNYTLFLVCGYLPWLLFQETVTRSASSLLEHTNLVTKTVFPSEMVPISIFFSSLLNHLMALTIAVAVVALWQHHFSVMLIFLPVYMAFLGLFSVGIGWVVAALQVYLRDTAQMLMVILTFWFWMTPIFISEQHIPEGVRFLVRLNPLAYVVRAYRERMLSYRLPDLSDLVVIAACGVASFVAGGLVFRHLKRGFADVL
jgi:ABC-type polysaccharide/polyol phosphate export permease